jgi:hypothetical protein
MLVDVTIGLGVDGDVLARWTDAAPVAHGAKHAICVGASSIFMP